MTSQRSLLGSVLLLLAALLLVIEAVAVLARFAVFAGASQAVTVSRWQWSDALRLGGAVLLGAAGYRLRRRSRQAPGGPA